MPTLYQKFNQQPPVVKGVIAVGLGLLGYGLYRSLKKKQEEKEATQAAQAAAIELEQLKQQGIVPSYSDSQFLSYANSLVEAMNGCGTDEAMIFSVFSALRNDADIRKLMVAFGLRYYQPCAVTSPISYAIWQLNDHAYGGELGTWLAYDLSSGDIAEINDILQSQGINFQF